MPLPSNFIEFLCICKKFIRLRSLHLEVLPESFLYGPVSQPFSFGRWKTKCTTKSHIFVSLLANSISSKNEHKEEIAECKLLLPTEYLIDMQAIYAESLSSHSCLWFGLVNLFIKMHPVLRSITITDSTKQGRMLCLRDVDVSDMSAVKVEINRIGNVLKTLYLPVLHLPMSGMVMEELTVAMFKVGSVGEEARDDNDGYDEIVNWEFEDGEELFGEAVTAIFQNKKNKSSSLYNDRAI